MLEELAWRPRRVLADAVHDESWRDQEGCGLRAPGSGEERSSRAAAAGAARNPSAAIAPIDEDAAAAARAHQALLVKPPGSLGRLEDVAAWYAAARGAFPVDAPDRTALAIFLADHGVVVEGVSAYGSQSTAADARATSWRGTRPPTSSRRAPPRSPWSSASWTWGSPGTRAPRPSRRSCRWSAPACAPARGTSASSLR